RRCRGGAASRRVALAATAVVLAVYLVIAPGVVVIAQPSLTSQIDDRLQASLRHITSEPPHPVGHGFDAPPGGPPGGRPLGPPLIVWTEHSGGTVTCHDRSLTLPAPYRSAAGPQPASSRRAGRRS